jgi:glutamate synthase (NADPH/NADH) small chain
VRTLIGIYSANDTLQDQSHEGLPLPKYDTPIVLGKDVVVFGGNWAMDSARTATRLGADRSESFIASKMRCLQDS